MYTWEIQKLMEIRNYLISVEEYFKICETSPQIREVSYSPYNDNFRIKTDDYYDVEFKVKKRERS